MSIAFVLFGWTLLVTTACAAVLSVCIGVFGWGCPISSSVLRVGTASRALINIAPISASAADDMTAQIIWAMLRTAPLLGGSSWSAERKKWPPALLRAFFSLS